jgi:hypothetical protein
VRAWKMLQLALNQAFDQRALDILLVLDVAPTLVVSGEGVLSCASLIAAGYVKITVVDSDDHGMFNWVMRKYFVELTPRGNRALEAWRRGDQSAFVLAGSRINGEQAKVGEGN